MSAAAAALTATAAALRQVADALDALAAQPMSAPLPAPPPIAPAWRERLWSCPSETRLGVRQVSEGTGRPRSWVYRACRGTETSPPLPHRKLDGVLVFVAGEVRQWLTEHEETVVPGRTGPLVVGRAR